MNSTRSSITLVIYSCMCFIDTFSDHEGNTSKTTRTEKDITILGKVLYFIGCQVGPSIKNSAYASGLVT